MIYSLHKRGASRIVRPFLVANYYNVKGNFATFNWLLLVLALLILFASSVAVGSVSIPFTEIVKTLSGLQENATWKFIVWELRLPKALTAVLVGVALSVAGLVMQTFFANPLASPSELGVSAGASLGVASITLSSGISWSAFQQWGLVGNSFVAIIAILGAMLVMLLLLLMSRFVWNNTTLLIVGLMLGSLAISLIGLWQFLSSPEQIRDFLWWSFGSLAGTNYSQIAVLAFLVAMSLLLLFLQTQKLNALLLGEMYARSMGVNIRKLRWVLIVVVSVLSGVTTAFCGPIGFVGLAVPHLARSLFQTANHWTLFPASTLLGASVLLFCDILAYNLFANFALPINLVTSLLGSPIVIWIVIRRSFRF
ncbi:FecCD family ABC transporter permease [Raineya orbicola]|uniref:ABC-type Fe3+-siderophore transport system permease component n=1 Tax=Raineya orbicola TaxID=2016530 RepID=A0A2N3I8T5_9BACT|nr:iron ABC transporter permease [Raineya orbicola]PKQ66716.1 ABC-type Fe3+-siderophore transport system permease component [Raineya orbicola]